MMPMDPKDDDKKKYEDMLDQMAEAYPELADKIDSLSSDIDDLDSKDVGDAASEAHEPEDDNEDEEEPNLKSPAAILAIGKAPIPDHLKDEGDEEEPEVKIKIKPKKK